MPYIQKSANSAYGITQNSYTVNGQLLNYRPLLKDSKKDTDENESEQMENLANKYFFQPFNSFMALEETASGSEKGENECQIEKVENKFVHLNILLPLCI